MLLDEEVSVLCNAMRCRRGQRDVNSINKNISAARTYNTDYNYSDYDDASEFIHKRRLLSVVLVSHTGLRSWPAVQMALLTNLKQIKNLVLTAGTLGALHKLVEDTGDGILTMNKGEEKGIDEQFLKALLTYLTHPNVECRVMAMRVLYILIEADASCIMVHLEHVVKSLARLCADQNVKVQTHLVETLSGVVNVFFYHEIFKRGNTFASICRYSTTVCWVRAE